jgi:hypothetical protein
MSALNTASNVIKWAKKNQSCMPPMGDFRMPDQLSHPPKYLRDELAQLTAITAARMRLNNPPLDDKAPLPSGALVIAAAIGVFFIPELFQVIISATPEINMHSPLDWIARHALIHPALPYVSYPIADDLMNRSPLTALIKRPAEGQDAMAMKVLQTVLSKEDGKRLLTIHLATPVSDMKTRRWRYHLMDTLRLDHPEFVLDIYETLMIHHWNSALAQINTAKRILTRPELSKDNEKLQEAQSIADFWRPLWALERSNIQAIRKRRYIGYDYRKGISLIKMCL